MEIPNWLYIYKYFIRELNKTNWVYAINKKSGVASATEESIPYPLSNYNKIDFIRIANYYNLNDFSKIEKILESH